MIVTVASFKGGVGKTTSALHLAAYFQDKAPTLLVDGDLNRSALYGLAKRMLHIHKESLLNEINYVGSVEDRDSGIS
jgi:cellulose biosynthesis protein BcsQ